MKKQTRRVLLSSFAGTAATATLVASIPFIVKTCSNKKDMNSLISKLIFLNKKTDYLFENSTHENEFINLDYLLEYENEIFKLIQESNILNDDINNSKNKTEDFDFENIKYNGNQNIVMPKGLINKVETADVNILTTAKKVANDEIDSMMNVSEEEKQRVREDVKNSKTVQEIIDSLKFVRTVEKFSIDLQDSIYYSKKAKSLILSEFKKHTDRDVILNFIDSYTYVTSIKQDFYDSNLSKEAKTDSPIKYLNREKFLDAVAIENVNSSIKEINELFELKKELLSVLDVYINTFQPQNYLLTAQRRNRYFFATKMQNILFSATKADINNFKNMLIKFMEQVSIDPNYDIASGYIYRIQPIQGENDHIFYWGDNFITAHTMLAVDEELYNDWLTPKDDEDVNEEDSGFVDSENIRNFMHTLDIHNDSRVFINYFSLGEDNEVLYPLFRYKFFDLYDYKFKLPSDDVSFERQQGFSFGRFLSRSNVEKDFNEKRRIYEIELAIMQRLFLNINRTKMYEHYNDYFASHNIDKELANKRYQFLSNYSNNIKENVDYVLNEDLILEFYRLTRTNDINDVEENVNKFLEFLDSKITE
ncbi:hypothetical protein [Metamycoplasma gateae]|uniref:Uncharacterized protein n=1 Tax=Metamycoplasma gateae TaxID=35769 RepID=A0ABZ2AGM8_9BACT|nr:hypothetical protein V2E26_02555 [Metamycoplasma gateae]